MALPPWTIELLRRGIGDVAKKASEPETLRRWKTQATGLLQELPETAARGIDRVIQTAEAGKESVQKWAARKRTELTVSAINASGVLIHPWGTGVPIAPAVADVGQELFRGDSLLGPAARQRISRRLQRSVPEGDGRAVAVAASFPAALSALSLLSGHRSLVVHRWHATRLFGGIPLPELFAQGLPVVTEVGGSDVVRPEDFAGIERLAAIMADNESRSIEPLEGLPDDAIQVAVLPIGRFHEPGTEEQAVEPEIPSAVGLLRQGVDLIVLPGDGLAGGPTCGLLVGRRDEIEWIRSSTSWAALEAVPAVGAMMAAAIESSRPGAGELTVDRLLDTNVENLRDRAERLATRLSGFESITSARVTAEDARITPLGRWQLPSRQVVATHRSLSGDAWAERAVGESPAVVTTPDGESLRVDLRWVDPADDGTIAETLGRF